MDLDEFMHIGGFGTFTAVLSRVAARRGDRAPATITQASVRRSAQTVAKRIAVDGVVAAAWPRFHARQLQAFDAGDFDAKQIA